VNPDRKSLWDWCAKRRFSLFDVIFITVIGSMIQSGLHALISAVL
jgi:hypothetical protein